MTRLILASTSPYRAAILARLHLDFMPVAPAVPEDRLPGESGTALCRRLAESKARAVAANGALPPPFIVIGSDQVAFALDRPDRILGKPGGRTAAREQLTACAGRWVRFETAICLVDGTGRCRIDADQYDVRFRDLDGDEIERYLDVDEPWDCAGSIKAESGGMALIAETRGQDFNTLLGLPLIRLVSLLDGLGFRVIDHMKKVT